MSPTPAILARLRHRPALPPAPEQPLVRLVLPAPAITWAEQAREADVLDQLADATAKHGSWAAAVQLFGGTR